jgi:hypothetical protein
MAKKGLGFQEAVMLEQVLVVWQLRQAHLALQIQVEAVVVAVEIMQPLIAAVLAALAS